jgi:hypothetical protein
MARSCGVPAAGTTSRLVQSGFAPRRLNAVVCGMISQFGIAPEKMFAG